MNEHDLVKVSRALADETRLNILRAISREPRLLCCGDLARECAVTPATVTHHLRVLGEAGLIELHRNGQYTYVKAQHRALDSYRRALGRALSASREG